MKDWKTYDWTAGVGPGWKGIVQPLVDLHVRKNFPIVQVKEKFGGLRFYVDRSDVETTAAVDAAETASWKTCETCGKPGSMRSRHGWSTTQCDEHKP